jgi:hypothetical protein
MSDPSAITSLLLLGTGGLFGVLITQLVTILNARSSRKSEERKHYRELIVKAAIENWKQQMEAYAVHQQPMVHIPLEVYLIQMVKFSELFMDPEAKLTESSVSELYQEFRRVGNAAIKAADGGPRVSVRGR